VDLASTIDVLVLQLEHVIACFDIRAPEYVKLDQLGQMSVLMDVLVDVLDEGGPVGAVQKARLDALLERINQVEQACYRAGDTCN